MKLIIGIHILGSEGTDIISTNRQWYITNLWALINQDRIVSFLGFLIYHLEQGISNSGAVWRSESERALSPSESQGTDLGYLCFQDTHDAKWIPARI